MGWNRKMKTISTILLLKKLSTRRAPLVMSRGDGCKKLEIILSLDFLRSCGTQKRSRKEAHHALPSKTTAKSCTTQFHLAKRNYSCLAKEVKLSARLKAPKQFLPLSLCFILCYFVFSVIVRVLCLLKLS